MTQLAILGGGFMGGALAQGLVDSGFSPDAIVVAEIVEERRAFLTEKLGVDTTAEPSTAVAAADTVLLAVKPQVALAVLDDVAQAFDASKLAISICAGITLRAIEDALGDVPAIRAMPNTPAAIGQGATALARGRFAEDSHLAVAVHLLSTVGEVVVVDEGQMDAVTAVSGSGPAYVFYLAEAMISAALNEGLSQEQASALVYQTLVGASALLARDPAGPEELRARVTSPGGTTQAAIEVLESAGWKAEMEAAVARARQRSEELGA